MLDTSSNKCSRSGTCFKSNEEYTTFFCESQEERWMSKHTLVYFSSFPENSKVYNNTKNVAGTLTSFSCMTAQKYKNSNIDCDWSGVTDLMYQQSDRAVHCRRQLPTQFHSTDYQLQSSQSTTQLTILNTNKYR